MTQTKIFVSENVKSNTEIELIIDLALIKFRRSRAGGAGG